MVDSHIRMHFSPEPIGDGGTIVLDTPAESLIPRYTLYGDALDRPGWFVNVEPLERRSRERGWIIKPHTHPRMTQIVVCTRGSGYMTVEGETVPFGPGSAMVVPPHCIHGFNHGRTVRGWVVTIETLYLEGLLRRAPELKRVVRNPGVFFLSGEGWGEQAGDTASDTASEIGGTMLRLQGELDRADRGGAIGAEIQLLSLLLLFLRLWPKGEPARPVLGSRAELVQRFRALVEQTYREQPLLSHMASELGVSVSQLRLACTAVAGIPPIEIVHDRLLAEAKRCLSYTPMRIAEIATWLGFNDAAYFSRFFSKTAGVPPSVFRQQNASW